jgi:hypothetical protein
MSRVSHNLLNLLPVCPTPVDNQSSTATGSLLIVWTVGHIAIVTPQARADRPNLFLDFSSSPATLAEVFINEVHCAKENNHTFNDVLHAKRFAWKHRRFAR